MTKTVLIIVLLSFTAGVSMASEDIKQSQKEHYESQEKCRKKVDEFIQKQGYSGYILDHDNHYNVKLNKCFAYIRLTKYSHSTITKYYYHVYDVDDNREYDSLAFTSSDNVENKINEFTTRISPYMTE